MKAIFFAIIFVLIAGCVEPESPSPKYSDLPNPHYRPKHDVTLEP